VHLEMKGPALWIAEGGTFEVHHNFLRGNSILATIGHNSNIIGLQQSVVVILVSWRIEQSVTTGERPEMVAAKAGNFSPLVDEVELWVTQIGCL